MTLKDGDKVTLDGVEMEVTAAPPDGYWLKETGTGSYYYMQYKAQKDIDELEKAGRLKLGKVTKIEGGSKYCSWHKWKKYVGIKEVYNFCENCGVKEFKDWRLIKDEKDY